MLILIQQNIRNMVVNSLLLLKKKFLNKIVTDITDIRNLFPGYYLC
jgi:hypothetical protein